MPSFKGVRLKGDTISYKRDSYPVAGVTATVESAGDIDRRLSATRVAGGALLLGPLGALLGGLSKKKQDSRQMFLIVEGPEFAWAVEIRMDSGLGSSAVNRKLEKKARKFAAKVTTAGRQAAT